MKLFRNKNTIDNDVADALSELSNVGVGKATGTLGSLIGERITLGTPRILPVNAGLDTIAGSDADKLAVGIIMRLTQSLGGIVLVLLDKDSVSHLVEKMTGVRYENEDLVNNEDSLSAVFEMANMMAASYMTAIASYTGLRVYLTPMMAGLDMAGALISYPLAEMSMTGRNVISIDSSFNIEGRSGDNMQCSGRMIMLPDESSIDKIVKTLGLE